MAVGGPSADRRPGSGYQPQPQQNIPKPNKWKNMMQQLRKNMPAPGGAAGEAVGANVQPNQPMRG